MLQEKMHPSNSRVVRLLAVAVLGCAVSLAGCAKSDAPAPKPTRSPSPSASPSPELVAEYRAPLRGDLIAAPATGPSLAVKIDNHEFARPQVGIDRADVVFEELVEGGLTRYVALFHADVPELVGPVRSIRPMDPDILTPLGGIVVYSGGAEQFVAMMLDTPVLNVSEDGGSDAFERDWSRSAPHNLFVHAADVVAAHGDLAPPPPLFSFANSAQESSAVRSGAPAQLLSLRFSDQRFPSWAWDGAQQRYVRSQEGAPDVDVAGVQRAATNVIALSVPIERGDVPITQLVGSGEAWVSTGGFTVRGTWSKADRASGIQLVDAAGAPLLIAPGASWVELVPADDGAVQVG